MVTFACLKSSAKTIATYAAYDPVTKSTCDHLKVLIEQVNCNEKVIKHSKWVKLVLTFGDWKFFYVRKKAKVRK